MALAKLVVTPILSPQPIVATTNNHQAGCNQSKNKTAILDNCMIKNNLPGERKGINFSNNALEMAAPAKNIAISTDKIKASPSSPTLG